MKLREAAAAVMEQLKHGWVEESDPVAQDLKAALAEPVQEEVYWYVGTDGKYYSSNEVKLFMDANTKALHLDPPQWRKDKGDLIPLYTAPPQQPDPDRIHTCSICCAKLNELRDKLFNQKGNQNEDVQGYGV